MKEENDVKIARDKVGVVQAAKCCAHCEHASGSICKLQQVGIYPASVCNNYKESAKKVKTKFGNNEFYNKQWTINYYLTGKGVDAKYCLSDLRGYLPSATLDKTIDTMRAKGFTNPEYEEFIYGGWSSTVNYQGRDIALYFVIDYSLARKVAKASVDYLYDQIKKEIELEETI